MEESFGPLARRIDRTRRLQGLRLKLVGATLVLTVALGELLGYSVLDLVVKFSQAGRAVAFGLCLAILGTLAWVYLIHPILRGLARGRVAQDVERQHGELGASLSTSVEFGQDDERTERLSSHALVGELVRTTRERTEAIDFTKTVTWRRPAVLGAAGGLVAAVVVLYAALWPHLALPSFQRLALPWADIPPPTFTRIDEASLGDHEVPRHSDLTLTVHTAGIEPDSVTLYRCEDDETETAVEMTRLGTHHFGVTLAALEESFTYRITARDARSEDYAVEVYTEPRVEAIDLRLVYPDYTRKDPRPLKNAFGRVDALRGTTVEVAVRANVPLSNGTLDFDQGSDVALGVKGDTGLEGSFVVRDSDQYRIRLADAKGRPNRRPIAYQIRAQDDLHPTVRIRKPKRDLVAKPDRKVPIDVEVEATDDYGIAELGLVHAHNAHEQSTTLDKLGKPQRTLDRKTPLDLAALDLKPGDIVTYYAYVVDNDLVTGPKRAISDIHFIRIYAEPPDTQTPQQPKTDFAAHLQKNLEDLIKKQKELTREAHKLASERKEKPTPKEQKARKELAERQNQLAKQTRQVAKALREALRRDGVQRTPESLRRLANATEQMQKAEQALKHPDLEKARQAAAQALRELAKAQQALEQPKPPEQRAFAKADRRQAEELRERLDNRTQQAEHIAQLAHEQQRIRDQLAKPENLDEPQRKALENQLRELEDATRRLATQLAQQPHEPEQHAANDLDRAARHMQQAQDAARQDKPKQAQADARRALEQLHKGRDELQQAAQNDIDRAVRDAARRAKDLERDQALLAQATEPHTHQKPADQPGPEKPEPGEPQAGRPEAGKPEPGEREAGKPEAGQPEAGKPEAEEPEAGKPEPGEPEAGEPEAGNPEAGEPEVGKPEAGRPEPGEPEAGKPEAGKPEPGQPEAGKPEAGKPEAGEAQPGKPQAAKPDAGEPEPEKPEAGEPEAGEPEAGKPEAGKPVAREPEAGKPEAGKPEAGEPEAGRPEAGKPEAREPEAGKPEAGEPEAGEPEAGKPEAGKPEAGEPEAGKQEAGEPEAGKPEAGKPEAGKPRAGQPKAGQPAPGQPQPGQPQQPQPLEQTARQQQELRRELDQLGRELDGLARHAERADNPAAQALREAAREARQGDAPQGMDRAARELEAERPQPALEAQQQAKKGLREMAGRLGQAADEADARNAEALEQARNHAQQLAEAQKGLNEKMPEGQQPAPDLARKEADLRKLAEQVGDHVRRNRIMEDAEQAEPADRAFDEAAKAMGKAERTLAQAEPRESQPQKGQQPMPGQAPARQEGQRAVRALGQAQEAMQTALDRKLAERATDAAQQAREASQAQQRAGEALSKALQRADKGERPAPRDQKSMARSQAEAAARAESLERKMSQIRERAPASQGGAGEELEDVARDLAQAQLPRRMRQVQEQLERSRPPGAPEMAELQREQQKAAEKLDEVQERLRDAARDLTGTDAERIETARRQVDRAARKVDDARQALERPDAPRPTPKAEDLRQAKQKAQEARRELDSLDRRLSRLQPTKAEQRKLEEAKRELERAREGMGSDRPELAKGGLDKTKKALQVIGDGLVKRLDQATQKRDVKEPLDHQAPEEYRELVKKYHKAVSED